MEKEVLRKKIILQQICDACHFLNGWHNKYSRKSIHPESNYGVTNTTVSSEKD